MKFKLGLAAVFITVLLGKSLAQIIDVNFIGGGTTSYSAWTNPNNTTYPGLSRFPGTIAWTGPAFANDGDVRPTLNWAAAGVFGGPFFASKSIYFSGGVTGGSGLTNEFAGTLQVSNNFPLSDLRTLVFQLQIGESKGYDFYEPSGFPTLSINNEAPQAALFARPFNRIYIGPDPVTSSPMYENTWAFQWNLTNEPIVSSYSIDFSAVTHATVFGLRLDGTSVLQSAEVIPEPSVVHLLALCGLVLGVYLARKRRLVRS